MLLSCVCSEGNSSPPLCLRLTPLLAPSWRGAGSGVRLGEVEGRWGIFQGKIQPDSLGPWRSGRQPHVPAQGPRSPLALVLSMQCPQDSGAGQGHARKSSLVPALQPHHQLLAQGAISAEAA